MFSELRRSLMGLTRTSGLMSFRGLPRRDDLGTAHVVGVVQDLALEVAQVDDVEVDDAELADAGGGEVEGGRRAESARAEQQHLRFEELALPDAAHLGHDDVPLIALELLRGERER